MNAFVACGMNFADSVSAHKRITSSPSLARRLINFITADVKKAQATSKYSRELYELEINGTHSSVTPTDF